MLEKLEAFKSTIVDTPPYRAGVLDVDPQNLILFYGKDKNARFAPLLPHVPKDPALFTILDVSIFQRPRKRRSSISQTLVTRLLLA